MSCDAHPDAVAGPADAALDHVAGPELPPDARRVGGLPLVGEGRAAADHAQVREAAQRRDQVLGDPVAEVLLPRVAALVGERQDGDDGRGGHHRFGHRRALLAMLPDETAAREPEGDGSPGEQEEDRCARARPAWHAASGRFDGSESGGARPVQAYAEDGHGLGDVLDLVLAQGLEGEVELAADVVVDRPRDQDAARLGELLQAGGDVDAVAVDVLAIDDHVAEIDADAELEPVLRREGGVALAQGPLDVDGAGQRLDDAREVGQHAVARRADDAAVVLGDEPVDDLAAGPQAGVRAGLVVVHLAREADRVGAQDRGQLAPVAARHAFGSRFRRSGRHRVVKSSAKAHP